MDELEGTTWTGTMDTDNVILTFETFNNEITFSVYTDIEGIYSMFGTAQCNKLVLNSDLEGPIDTWKATVISVTPTTMTLSVNNNSFSLTKSEL